MKSLTNIVAVLFTIAFLAALAYIVVFPFQFAAEIFVGLDKQSGTILVAAGITGLICTSIIARSIRRLNNNGKKHQLQLEKIAVSFKR